MTRIDWSTHHDQAKAENIKFLLGTCGLHPDLVARRLGISPDALAKFLERNPDAKPDPAPATRSGESA